MRVSFWRASGVAGLVLSLFALSPTLRAEDAASDCVLTTTKKLETVFTRIEGPQTFVSRDGQLFRLASLIIPSASININNRTDGRLAQRSQRALTRLVLNKPVTLRIIAAKKDRYGRLSAHVFLPREQAWVQAKMVTQGLARVFPITLNDPCVVELLRLEDQARKTSVGLWADKYYKVIQADNLKNLHRSVGRLHLVEGRVHSVAIRKSLSYINFSKNWRSDFTVTIAKSAQKRFLKQGMDIKKLSGKNIRVRGWLDRRNGPTINAAHVAQIEILDE